MRWSRACALRRCTHHTSRYAQLQSARTTLTQSLLAHAPVSSPEQLWRAWSPKHERSSKHHAGERHAHSFECIEVACIRGHSHELAHTPERPIASPLMHSREAVRHVLVVSCADEKSVESMRVVAAERCLPSGSTSGSSCKPRAQPREHQDAPFCVAPVLHEQRLRL